jgi:sirohydrochlorin ferrochelatase
MSFGIVVIAHGSRRAQANQDLLKVAEALRERQPGCFVEPAYLELAEPSIPASLERCYAAGARQIRMLPFFLSAGAHVTDDLVRYRDEFAAAHADAEVMLCPPLGLHPLLIDVLVERLGESLDGG